MGHYRARDLVLPPSLISLLRLPLAWAFVQVEDEPAYAMAVLALAGATDVLDGFVARRLGQATATGAVVDGVSDKLFVAVVLWALLASERVSLWGVAALGARELFELPLVVWWSMHRAQRGSRAEDPKANYIGKLATIAQFVAIAMLLTGQGPLTAMLIVTAMVGIAAALLYWARELGALGERNRPA